MIQQQDDKESFFFRWSRRKLQQSSPSQSASKEENKIGQTSPSEEKTIATDIPVWQQDDVEDRVKQAAMAALFRQAEFHEVDHLNEYDEDYTTFSKLGDIVTHEMKRMLKLAEEKTRPEISEDDGQKTNPEPENGDNTIA